MDIIYTASLENVDWNELTASLSRDDFDNGRTPHQLRLSFTNSHSCCLAVHNGRVVGTARVLSDSVCNAYLVDVWTLLEFRRQGIARSMIERLCQGLQGQHIYLQTDGDTLDFYRKLGFSEQPTGVSRVVGQWLKNDTIDA